MRFPESLHPSDQPVPDPTTSTPGRSGGRPLGGVLPPGQPRLGLVALHSPSSCRVRYFLHLLSQDAFFRRPPNLPKLRVGKVWSRRAYLTLSGAVRTPYE